MSDEIGPAKALDLGLIEMHVRGDVVLDLLVLSCAALAEVGVRAARIGADDIADHVAGTLDLIQRRVEPLVREEEDRRAD
jgi:hypothetical protein